MTGRWATIEDLGDDRCRLRMTSDSLDWPLLLLGASGADFDIVSPPELVHHMRDWATRFNRALGLALPGQSV
jgi:predicted DNA-binding transcriptional regulator YafY